MYVAILSTAVGTVPVAWFSVGMLDAGLWGICWGVLLGWTVRSAASYFRLRYMNRARNTL